MYASLLSFFSLLYVLFKSMYYYYYVLLPVRQEITDNDLITDNAFPPPFSCRVFAVEYNSAVTYCALFWTRFGPWPTVKEEEKRSQEEGMKMDLASLMLIHIFIYLSNYYAKNCQAFVTCNQFQKKKSIMKQLNTCY